MQHEAIRLSLPGNEGTSQTARPDDCSSCSVPCLVRKHGVAIFGIVDLSTSLALPEQLLLYYVVPTYVLSTVPIRLSVYSRYPS